MRYRLLGVVPILSLVVGSTLADEAKQPETGCVQPKLPALKYSTKEDWYPAQARFCNLQGRVLMVFDITSAGVAKNASILWAEDQVFAKSALRMLAGAHFSVSDDWATTGAWRRWRVGVVYRLASPAPIQQQSDEFAIPVEKIYVTGSSVPKAHQSKSCPPSR